MSPSPLIVLGCSAGGLRLLQMLLPGVRRDSAPLVICSHSASQSMQGFCDLLAVACGLPVVEAEERQRPARGHVYVAPAGYHLLVEPDRRFALSVDPRVSFARPSIDVLFESAARVFGPTLAGIVCTGANHDGAAGLKAVRQAGGTAVVQRPDTAEADAMPNAAIEQAGVDHLLAPDEIAAFISDWGHP